MQCFARRISRHDYSRKWRLWTKPRSRCIKPHTESGRYVFYTHLKISDCVIRAIALVILLVLHKTHWRTERAQLNVGGSAARCDELSAHTVFVLCAFVLSGFGGSGLNVPDACVCDIFAHFVLAPAVAFIRVYDKSFNADSPRSVVCRTSSTRPKKNLFASIVTCFFSKCDFCAITTWAGFKFRVIYQSSWENWIIMVIPGWMHYSLFAFNITGVSYENTTTELFEILCDYNYLIKYAHVTYILEKNTL